MSIADKLRKVLEIKNDIKSALEGQGIDAGNDFSTYADDIASISGGSGGNGELLPLDPPVVEIPEIPEPEPWVQPEDWLDLDTILENNVIEGYPYRIAMMVKDSETISLVEDTCKIKLSDSTEYDKVRAFPEEYYFNRFDHTWTGEAENGYRWVIYYFNRQTVNFIGLVSNCIRIILDGISVNFRGGGLSASGNFFTYAYTLTNTEVVSLEGKGNVEVCSYEDGITPSSVFKEAKNLVNVSGIGLRKDSKEYPINYFKDCIKLKYLPSDIFDGVVWKGTDFRYMFQNCNSLLRIPPIDTSNGIWFEKMFQNCNSILTIPFIDISKGTNNNFTYMFSGCSSLLTIPLINTSNCTNFSGFFQFCSSLLTIPPINTSSGTNFSNFFNGCISLVTIPELDFSNATNIVYLFKDCCSLVYLPKINLPLVTSSSFSALNNCCSLDTIVELSVPLIPVTSISFNTLKDLRYVGKLDLSSVTSFSSAFKDCSKLEYLDLKCSSSTSFTSTFNGCRSLKKLFIDSTSNGTLFNAMFYDCYSIEEIPYIDTSKGTAFNQMFKNCYSLKSVPQLDFSNGINYAEIFQNCNSLEEAPELNLENVTTTSQNYLYSGCAFLKHIPSVSSTKIKSLSYLATEIGSIETVGDLILPSATSVSLFTNDYLFSKFRSIGTIDFSSFTSTISFPMTPLLTSLKFQGDIKYMFSFYTTGNMLYSWNTTINVENLEIESLNASWDLSQWNLLTHESLLNVINALVPQEGTTKTLKLGSTNLAKLTEEEIAIGTDKGWTLTT